MRAIDTNLLVRLIVRDDRFQLERAEDFVSQGAWASLIVLAETASALDAVYRLRPGEIAEAIEMLLASSQLSIQDSDVVTDAVAAFRKRPAVDFADHLILAIARKNGNLPLGTFDRDLARLEGTQLL